eukprot:g122.t2
MPRPWCHLRVPGAAWCQDKTESKGKDQKDSRREKKESSSPPRKEPGLRRKPGEVLRVFERYNSEDEEEKPSPAEDCGSHAVSIGPDFTCAVGSCFDLVQEKRKKDEDTRDAEKRDEDEDDKPSPAEEKRKKDDSEAGEDDASSQPSEKRERLSPEEEPPTTSDGHTGAVESGGQWG